MGEPREIRRVGPADGPWEEVRALLLGAYAYMEGRIDPPSSLTRFGVAEMRAAAAQGPVLLAMDGPRPVACLFAAPRGGALHLSKIAVAREVRGQGLLRRLLVEADREARARGLATLTLESRIELTETHAAFRRLGFVAIGTTAHPGYDRPTSVSFHRPVPAVSETAP